MPIGPARRQAVSAAEASFAHRFLQLVERHADRGGSIHGVGLLVKRAAIQAGLPGAHLMHTNVPGDPARAAELDRDLGVAADAVEAARAACDAVWRRWGYPEAHLALMALGDAAEALSPSDEMPPATRQGVTLCVSVASSTTSSAQPARPAYRRLRRVSTSPATPSPDRHPERPGFAVIPTARRRP